MSRVGLGAVTGAVGRSYLRHLQDHLVRSRRADLRNRIGHEAFVYIAAVRVYIAVQEPHGRKARIPAGQGRIRLSGQPARVRARLRGGVEGERCRSTRSSADLLAAVR